MTSACMLTAFRMRQSERRRHHLKKGAAGGRCGHGFYKVLLGSSGFDKVLWSMPKDLQELSRTWQNQAEPYRLFVARRNLLAFLLRRFPGSGLSHLAVLF